MSKKEKKGRSKKGKHLQTQTRYKIHIQTMSTIPTSTANIQTSLENIFHVINILPKDNTYSKHKRQQENTRSKHKKEQNINIIITLQIIPILTFILNIEIHHFKTTFHILNTLTTYKYTHFKKVRKLDPS